MRKALLVVLILSAAVAWAQGGCTGQKPLNGMTTGGYLKGVANASVRVCSDTLTPCTTIALYSDAALTQSISNPVTTDATGNYQYCAASGSYNEQISGAAFSTLNNTPVTISGSGDVTQAGNNKFTGLSAGIFAPQYFYAGTGFKASQIARAQHSWYAGSAFSAPVHVLLVGDSISGYNLPTLKAAAAQYGGINATGAVQAYANTWGNDLTTYSNAGCTLTRNDTASTSAWGVSGGRADCTTGNGISVKSIYPADKYWIFYNKTNGGGSFNWSVDGGATTNISTDTLGGADSLGVVAISGQDATVAHLISAITSSGSVRFYVISSENSTQSGLVFDVLQSGGSQASQWNGHMAYAAQFASTVNATTAVIWLGANDVTVGLRTASQFSSDISGIASSLPAGTSIVLMTNTPRGNSDGTPDTASNATFAQYRTSLLSLATANGWSVFDTLNYWPDFSTAYAGGGANTMYSSDGVGTPIIHPSQWAAFYTWSGLSKALFQLSDGPNWQNLSPSGRLFSISAASSGALSATLANSADRPTILNLQAGKTTGASVEYRYSDQNFACKWRTYMDTTVPTNWIIDDCGGNAHVVVTPTGIQLRMNTGGSISFRTLSGTTVGSVDLTGKGTFNGGLAAGSAGQFAVDASGNVTGANLTSASGQVAATDSTASAIIGTFGPTGGGIGKCFFQNAGSPTTRTRFQCNSAAGANVLSVDPAGGVQIGANGSSLGTIITGSGTLTYTAIAAQTCQEQPLTVTNSSTTNFGVHASPRSTLGNTNLSWSAWVSAAGTVSVRVCNNTAGSITPSAVAWGVTVTQ